jgi:hypothetical protein
MVYATPSEQPIPFLNWSLGTHGCSGASSLARQGESHYTTIFAAVDGGEAREL